MNKLISLSNEVQNAIKNNHPVLALESTLITHGLPTSVKLETAIELEHIARIAGATPATIAVMDGKVKIGLNEEELKQLATHPTPKKASKRDLPTMLAEHETAGTTVAATMFCAHLAGIKFFATGGIGGVHRGDDMDISADLIELATTPVTVICAGAKAILDLPRTLEYLETYSVPVIGYQTDYFPAFYTAASPLKLTMRSDTIESLGNIIRHHSALNMKSGILVTNPIPKNEEISADIIEPIIQQALRKASQQNISGKDMTPFLLSELVEATQGKSLRANLALIKNNVRLGAELASAE